MIHTTSSIRRWGCKRQYKHEYIDLIRPRRTGKSFVFGSAIHAGLEAYWLGEDGSEATAKTVKYITDSGIDDMETESAKARALIDKYYLAWFATCGTWETLHVEKPFEIQLADDVRYAGKIDVIAKANNKIYVIDHKTTSDDISGFGCDYYVKLSYDLQIAAYSEAVKRILGMEDLPRVLWDVIKKPLAHQKKKETFPEFCNRLYDRIDIKESFVRHEVHRTQEQHNAQIDELVEICREIQGYKGLYPRNDSLCFGKYGKCPYINVCSGIESLDSDSFVKINDPHPELKT